MNFSLKIIQTIAFFLLDNCSSLEDDNINDDNKEATIAIITKEAAYSELVHALYTLSHLILATL